VPAEERAMSAAARRHAARWSSTAPTLHALAPGALLLATDGTPAARAATRVAAALAERAGMRPHVLTALPPRAALDPTAPAILGRDGLADELCREIGRQLATCSPDAAQWSRESVVGAPAAEIVRVARTRQADLIVLGLRPHLAFERIYRDETALSVIREANRPVFAVTPRLKRLPRRIAVAVDFSRASIAAAHAALDVVDERGTLVLAYVEPTGSMWPAEVDPYGAIYHQGVAGAFARLRQELAVRADVSIDTVVLHGSVRAELLGLARRAGADAIALGTQQHSIARPAFLGSVPSALVRAATQSLLVVPPSTPR
jgi:nucleotide-binding universal stress UspA family protein